MPSRASPAAASTSPSTSPSVELPEPRVHVSSDLGHPHPGESGEQLGTPPDARRPDDHPRLQLLLAPDQDVQRIGALRHGGDHDPVLVLGGEVLRRVHGDVDLARTEGLDDPVDPEPLHARRRLGRCGTLRRRTSTSARSPSGRRWRRAAPRSPPACASARAERRVAIRRAVTPRRGGKGRGRGARPAALGVRPPGAGLGSFLQRRRSDRGAAWRRSRARARPPRRARRA